MENVYTTGSFAFSAIQAIAALFTLLDRARWKAAMNDSGLQRTPDTGIHLLIFGFLIVGAVCAGTLGGYAWGHPVKPTIITNTAYVDKPLPCPPSKSGAATTSGLQSPAITGSSNPTTYSNIPVSPTKKPN